MGNRQQFQILETGKISIGTKENIISRIWTGRKLVLIVGTGKKQMMVAWFIVKVILPKQIEIQVRYAQSKT